MTRIQSEKHEQPENDENRCICITITVRDARYRTPDPMCTAHKRAYENM